MNITLHNIHKRYGNLKANDSISFEIKEGTIHGLLGENGAGKSTLMKILAGYIPKTQGTIKLDGRPCEYSTPSKATTLGIGMLYQDPLDFPALSVLENYIMGLPGDFILHKDSYKDQLYQYSSQYGFNLDPDSPVGALSVGERQQLEILRLLALGIDVLILDEPTTGISKIQKKVLFNGLRLLADQGKTVLIVSHKLEDIESLCDRVSVLRNGRLVSEMAQPFDVEELLKWMFGNIPPPPPCASSLQGPEILYLSDVSTDFGRTGLRDCNVTIHRGEVVGLAGIEGSGQEAFLRISAGLARLRKGNISINGEDLTYQDHHVYQSRGVTFLPTARLEEGLIRNLSIAEHFALKQKKGIQIRSQESIEKAKDKIKEYNIIGEPFSFVESLSGGNQQRLLLALLPENPLILLLENPARGLDLESARWVWEQLIIYASNGASIIFSSPELDEIFQMSDRILVFFNGSIVKDVKTCDVDISELAQMIAGKGSV